MSKVTMEKDGATIQVNDALVAQHEMLGWRVKPVSNTLSNVDIVIGAEDTDVINVAVQLINEDGAALADSISVMAFLADAVEALGATATAPDGNVAVGTNGGCTHLVTDKFFVLHMNAAGQADLDIGESGAATWYLVLIFPNGERVVSGAITFE